MILIHKCSLHFADMVVVVYHTCYSIHIQQTDSGIGKGCDVRICLVPGAVCFLWSLEFFIFFAHLPYYTCTSWFKHARYDITPNNCEARMPHALLATRMPHTYLVACRPPWTVEAGDIAVFFVKELGLALAPKTCPDQSQAFTEVNNNRAFTVGRKKKSFSSRRAASRCSKACLHKVSRKYSENWLLRTNIKSNLTPKIEFTLKPRNHDAKPWFLHSTHKSPIVHTVFEG